MSKCQRSPPSKAAKPDKTQINLSESSTLNVQQSSATQRNKRQRSHSTDFADEMSNLKEELLTSMKTLMANHSLRLDKLEDRIISIQEQNKSIQTTNKEIEKAMNGLSEDMKNIETKLSYLEQEKKKLELSVAQIESKLDYVEFTSLKTSVELRNVPKIPGEKRDQLYNSVLKLCDSLELSIRDIDIRDVYRLPSKKETTSSSVCIELCNTLKKSQILDGIKVYNKSHPTDKLSSLNLGMAGTKQPIFASELLSANTKRLFFCAREFAKKFNFAYTWSSNGRVFLRKEEGRPHIMIRSEAHLDELKKNETSLSK
ncbi:hypothetical protein JYU34_007914 [Plutella xylostella]|uniref:FP protein C-terminal domain-containing protein n=1 Tax=Plutella xylostella TaxID=51655 RepID=A0ABQ7QNC6_PLUXY|nr:hypothetical protein JYU34_007914 [Plutella xylostella]